MVKLTRLDGSELTVNANLIEVIEAHPDTVLTLITGKKYMVKETPEEIAELVVEYHKSCGGSGPVIYEDHCYRLDEYAS